MSHETLLVTGASGQLGRLVLDELLTQTDAAQIIATTRKPESLADYAAKGVNVRAADFDQPDSLAATFAGATRLLLISTDAVGARVESHRRAVEAAAAAGVKHIIYTSWPQAEQSPALVAPDHAATEKMIHDSGLSYTILRNNLYTENLIGSLKGALASGVLANASGGGKAAYVTRLDCARAAAGALLSDSFENRTLDVSGPEAYSNADVARIASELLGQQIQSLDLDDAAYKQALTGAGLPEFVADLLLSFEQAIRQGDAANVSTAVQDLSGQAPIDLPDFLKAHLAEIQN